MIQYRTLRFFALALRALQDALANLVISIREKANRVAEAARDKGVAAINATEVQAAAELCSYTNVTEALVARRVAKEDEMQEAYESLCYENSQRRRAILNEVI